MKTGDLITSAVSNAFRSKTRTLLTILAIFVGAFTLTITSGLGTGINRYIDDTVSSIGAEDVMAVTKTSDSTAGGIPTGDPVEYDPDAVASAQPGPPGAAGSVIAITPDDLKTLASIDGVLRVEATKTVTPDFIQHDGGTRWVIGAGSLIAGQTVELAAGTIPDSASDEYQVAVPLTFVDALGFDDADAAIGQTVTIAVSDPTRVQHEVEATVVGVAEETFTGGGASALPNQALTDELFGLQNSGVPADEQERFASASIWFDPDATAEQIDVLQADLEDAGFTGTTVADQLGAFTAVIDAIVLVLNGFAVIALLAASFGIVNTLLMSVQERTREIGLMKAMGMGSGRVFSLFSLEAMFIGFLGSAVGVGIGMLVGSAISTALADGPFADLPGLSLIAFDAASIVTIILIVMGIAFVAGTLPAARGAKADPVDSLRYE
jgi:putative ABC transport system permease protein